jgi:hypothetical protein
MKLQGCKISAPLAASQLPDLQMLHVFNDSLDPSSIFKLVSSSPSLRSFICEGVKECEACLDALANHCPRLQVLSYERVTPRSTDALVRVYQSCLLIEVVETYSSYNHEQISAIMQNCKRLKAFGAPASGKAIADTTALAIVARVHELDHLRLSYSRLESDAPLLALARHCRNLKSIEIDWMQDDGGIPETLLIELVSNLQSIVELNLNEHKLSTLVMEAIAAHCPLLQRLHMWNCRGIEDEGIVALAKGCAALKKVFVWEDEEALNPLARKLWQAMRPGLVFEDSDCFGAVWNQLEDVEREAFVIW